MAEHTPTPWSYRPHEHDDWGWIRANPRDGETIGPLVAITRSAKRETSEHWEEHRRNGTDPFQPNAAFIIKAVNNHEALVASLISAREAIWNGGDTISALSKIDAVLASVGSPIQPDNSTPRKA